ncbi:unnamed protein product (mitochondrion) [Plasmodiophora brassicae]|uniref:Uncharacterized protein n=1 Tax=Plasmodiophora brassicae TaxID=37360 RepID=A0A0G4INS7_PLABS|nr:hypothetical protein PBRA_005416 [Plasmodiophora brassicae]SPR00645.1 unnamed protein product [Plasmodiophora brassicae]
MTQRRRSNNLASAWTAYHDQALPRILVDLGDGLDGSKVTGAAVKQHDPQFDRLDSNLLNRKIREYRKRATSITLRRIGWWVLTTMKQKTTVVRIPHSSSASPVTQSRQWTTTTSFMTSLLRSERGRAWVASSPTCAFSRSYGWTSGTRASVLLSMVANHLVEYAVESSGRSLVVTYTQKNVDPEFYINQTMKSNVLKYEESKSILHYFEGKEQEIFTVRNPLPKKVEPDVVERYIFNESRPQYPAVLQLTMTAVKLAQYGVASQVQAL